MLVTRSYECIHDCERERERILQHHATKAWSLPPAGGLRIRIAVSALDQDLQSSVYMARKGQQYNVARAAEVPALPHRSTRNASPATVAQNAITGTQNASP